MNIAKIIEALRCDWQIEASEENQKVVFKTDVKKSFDFSEDSMIQIEGKFVVFATDFSASEYGTATVSVYKELQEFSSENLMKYLESDLLETFEDDTSAEVLQQFILTLAKSEKEFDRYDWYIFNYILGIISYSACKTDWDPNPGKHVRYRSHLRFVRDAIKVGTYPWDYYS